METQQGLSLNVRPIDVAVISLLVDAGIFSVEQLACRLERVKDCRNLTMYDAKSSIPSSSD